MTFYNPLALVYSPAVPKITDMLAASRQLDCCELFLVVFLKRGSELGDEARGFDCKSFDV
jgi:hypothetical protein